MVAGLRSIAKAMESPPEPTVRAPALDPTGEERRGNSSTTPCLLLHLTLPSECVSLNRPGFED
jgi:hypothetical protein